MIIRTFMVIVVIFNLIACGSGAKESSKLEKIATQTKKKLSPQLRNNLIKHAQNAIQTKLAQDHMQLQAFSLSLRAQGVIAIGSNRDKSRFNIYRFNADPLKYEKTFENVKIEPGSTIETITPLENGSFKILTHKNSKSEHYIFNYFDGTLKKEQSNSDDAIKATVEKDGMKFITYAYSLHGGGILAIGANETNDTFNIYRFDAATKKFEKVFKNVPIEKQSIIVSISPLEDGKFKITTQKNGQSRSAIMNYFNGDFYYEDSAGTNIENRLRDIVAKDGLTLQAYQYSLQHGGILAIGADDKLERYDFYRIDAKTLVVEEIYKDVPLYNGEIIKKITPMHNGKFLLETDFYGLKSQAIFDYFTGDFAYQE